MINSVSGFHAILEKTLPNIVAIKIKTNYRSSFANEELKWYRVWRKGTEKESSIEGLVDEQDIHSEQLYAG